MKRKTLTIIICTAVAAVIAAAGLSRYLTYKKPNTVGEGVILIYRNASYSAVMDSLKSSGTVKNIKSFERAARKRDLASHFEPGRYVIEPGMSNQYIIRMIANGKSNIERLHQDYRPSGRCPRPQLRSRLFRL